MSKEKHVSKDCHYWGEEDCDWEGINEVCKYLYTYCKRWGRLGLHTKEKFGQVRATPWFYHGGYFSFFWPGYVAYWPLKQLLGERLGSIAIKLQYFTVKHTPKWFTQLVYKYQQRVYARAYRNAIKKWPHLELEIISGMDFPELIGIKYEETVDDL